MFVTDHINLLPLEHTVAFVSFSLGVYKSPLGHVQLIKHGSPMYYIEEKVVENRKARGCMACWEFAHTSAKNIH